uniref:Regulator of Vps4 activity in the MVB pathway protein n=1 Tax=Kalanchoe fedtschenkoi TaxID=63787 RepID=A0A7N0UFG5_KALFE
MGKHLDALLKRSSLRSAKFKPLVNLAVHRLAVLKNQRQARCNIARSDVVEILKMGLHDRALIRVEHVIKEQNMLDVFALIQCYCELVLERFHLIEQEKYCPEELKEAISSLLYAASRCGEFPELQEIRAVFTSHYGKEFAARAIELRNNCGVSTSLIQKLSTRMPSLESRMSVLKQIADENGIGLNLGEASTEKRTEAGPATAPAATSTLEDDGASGERHFDSPKPRKYENAADAAQAAFESAAYAAQAARAAVELSRGDSHDSEGSSSPYPRRRKLSDQAENSGLGIQTKEEEKVSNAEETSSSFKEATTASLNALEAEEAAAGLKRSVSMSTESSMDSDAVVAQENQTVFVEYHADKMEHSDPPHDLLFQAAESQDTAAAAEEGPEESWFRRGWNSKMEKMKRPFSHRSRGVATH